MEYICGGTELAPRMEPMWKRLNAHHEAVSPYFKDYFARNTFESRMRDVGERMCIIIAHEDDRDAGYILAIVSKDGGDGEIASLYVESEYRGTGVADHLMDTAKGWLAERGAQKMWLSVACGNERAFAFYRRHGFYPRVTRLELCNPPPQTETERE